MPTSKIKVINAPWPQYQRILQDLRRTVFIKEQCVPEEDEWDLLDNKASHFIALIRPEKPAEKSPLSIGTARLLREGKITRMAVLAEWRHHGVGRALINHIIQFAQNTQLEALHADAQVSALAFYKKLGFTVSGAIFWDAGIEHRHIHLNLKQTSLIPK